ncbi:MAG: tetratricopeptide repeat protein [Myxococcales bacterium]|nr:tetratricopeptide repeat protein [Myxococcales bacterium]
MTELNEKRTNYRKAKLAKQDLTNLDLRQADLTGANLRKAKLAGMNLENAILEKADLLDADLNGTTLLRTNLRGSSIRGTWVKVQADCADFSGVLAQKWQLVDCRFSHVNFSQLNTRRVEFKNCTFEACDFTRANAPDAVLTNCRLIDCTIDQADFSCLVINQTEFQHVSLKQADFSGMIAEQSAFRDCDLTRALFIASEVKQFTLENNPYTKADFRHVNGLTEDQQAKILAAGGRISKRRLRKWIKSIWQTPKGKAAIIAVFALIVFFYYNATNNPSSWREEKLIRHANEASGKGDYDQALKYYKILLMRQKKDENDQAVFRTQIDIAHLDAAKKDFTNAFASLREALTVPNIGEMERRNAMLEILQLYLAKQDMAGFFAELEKMMAAQTVSDQMFELLNQVIGLTKDPQQLQSILALLDKHGSTAAPADKFQFLFYRALTLHEMRQDTEAENLLLALEQEPAIPPLLLRRSMMTRANIKELSQQIDDARAIYARLRELFPDAVQENDYAKINEANLLASQGKFAEAEKLYQEIISHTVSPEIENSTKMSLAIVYSNLRKFDQAHGLIDEALKYFKSDQPQYQEARIRQATIYADEGKNDKAISLLQEFLLWTTNKNYAAWAKRELSNIYRRLGRYEDAYALLREIADNPNAPETKVALLEEYATMLIEGNEVDRATNAITQALTIATGDQQINLKRRLYELQKQSGKIAEATITLNELTALPPPDKELHLWALLEQSNLERINNNLPKANKWLQEILAINWAPGQTPLNFAMTTRAQDPEGINLANKLYEKIIALEPEKSYLGGTARLVLAERLADEAIARKTAPSSRLEELLSGVIQANTDINLVIQAYDLLARPYLANGDYSRALQWYQKMEQNRSNDRLAIVAKLGQATVYAAQQQTDKALDLLATAQATCIDAMDCCRIGTEQLRILKKARKTDEIKKMNDFLRNKYFDCWASQNQDLVVNP